VPAYVIQNGETEAVVTAILETGVPHDATLSAYKVIDHTGADESAPEMRLIGPPAAASYTAAAPGVLPSITYTTDYYTTPQLLDATTAAIYVNSEEGSLSFGSDSGCSVTYAITDADGSVVNWVDLVEGAYRLTVTAVNDTSKDFVIRELTLYVDNTAPTVAWNVRQMINPQTNNIQLEGMTEGALSKLTLNGQDMLASNFNSGIFNFDGTLASAAASVEIVDLAGNKLVDELAFGVVASANVIVSTVVLDQSKVSIGGNAMATMDVAPAQSNLNVT